MTSKLTCEDVLEHLFSYLDQEVDEEMHTDIEHHLQQCRECYSRADFEQRLKQRIADTGESEAPEKLRRRIKTIIDRF